MADRQVHEHSNYDTTGQRYLGYFLLGIVALLAVGIMLKNGIPFPLG